jgi:hypothetical protein
MNRHDLLKTLSIEELIRLWFRLLWQKFDLGGISVGRSMRCNMLDCYLDFVSFPKLAGSLDNYNEGLWEEILSRPVVRKKRRTMTLYEINICSSEDLALLGLGTLLKLEYSVSADTAWKEGYELERKKIREVLKRFPIIYPSKKLDINQACFEIIKRKSDLEYEYFSKYQIEKVNTHSECGGQIMSTKGEGKKYGDFVCVKCGFFID